MSLYNFTGTDPAQPNTPPSGVTGGGYPGNTGVPGGTGGPVVPGNPGGPIGPGVPVGPGAPGGSGSSAGSGSSQYDPMEYLIDYNAKFANAGPTLFRDAVIHQLMGVLIGRNKPNCLLIGPAGTGKTKIVEDLAWRLANNDPVLPKRLVGSRVYELPLSNIVAGSSYVGQVEEKLKCVVDFLKSSPKNILFIDEIHVLADDALSQTYGKIAQILKPYLARGEIRVVGATTSQESGMLMDDPALNRRFSRVIVDEFTQAQTVEILKSMKLGLFQHYDRGISMTDDIFETTVKLADQYKPAGSHRPDNAITLLDRAIGDAVVDRKVMEKAAQGQPAVLQALQAMPLVAITEKQVKKTAIRLMTGNAKKNDFDVDAMRAALTSVVKGQDEPVETLLKLLRQHDMELFPKTTPLTLLFAGKSGVGKTEVTKIVARELTGLDPIILNMTEYHSSASINRIIGAPAGYVGSDSNAELPFDCLESNPYQVILLDEFEKGNRAVQRLFMGIFDEGFIKTNRGKTVDFSRCIIIATTNAGHTGGSTSKIGFGADDGAKALSVAETTATLKPYFDVELLNRFDRIVTFNPLTKNLYRDILQNVYAREYARIHADRPRLPLPAAIPDADLDAMVENTYVEEFGARPAGKAVREYIQDLV